MVQVLLPQNFQHGIFGLACMLPNKFSGVLTTEYAEHNLKLSFPPRVGHLHLYRYTLLLTHQMSDACAV